MHVCSGSELDDAIDALEIGAADRVRTGDLDAALRFILVAAERVWLNTLSSGHISGSAALDALCLRIGREIADDLPASRNRAQRAHRRFVYAVSELYRNGGHTRVLEDLIAAHPDDEHHVVWTNGEGAGEPDGLPDILRVTPLPFVHVLHGSSVEKLRTGFGILASLDADVLVHLGHPNDPLTLALMQDGLARRLVMIHIADTSFALGRHLSGAAHVALGRHFQNVAQAYVGLETTFLPLTCRSPNVASTIAGGEAAFVTATSGSAHKFNLAGTPSYLDVLAARFTRRDGTHVHVGPLDPAQRRRIDQCLRELSSEHRFVHIEHVPDLASALRDAGAALYLDSFPVGGARAVVEAMAVGLPVCAADIDFNLSGVSFAYPQCLTWRTRSDLEALFDALDDTTLSAHAGASREYFERVHSFAVFRARLDEIVDVD